MVETESSEVVKLWQENARSERDGMVNSLMPEIPTSVSINNCEVAYILNPTVLPYPNLNFVGLREAFSAEYGLHFKMPELGHLKAMPQLRLPESQDDLGQYLLSLPDPQLTFENGLLKLADHRAIKINEIQLTRERVFVKISGATKAGERVICEVVPLMWALTGVKRNWNDLAPYHQVAEYGTSTRVNFPGKGLGFLSEKFMGQMKEWTEPSGLLYSIGRRDAINDWSAPEGSEVIFSFDELHFLFHRHEPTGNSEVARMRVGVDVRHERGTGRMSVDSELPLDEHLQLVKQMLSAVAS